MKKPSILVCAALMTLTGLLLLPPVFTALAASAPTVGPFAPSDLTIGRSHLLFRAFEQYVQDNDDQLPPMSNAVVFDAALLPYVHDPSTFVSADTGRLFQPNAAISGYPVTQVRSLDTTEVFNDAAPGQPTIITFMDGHVEQNGIQSGNPVLVSISRAQALSLGVEQYAQDYDETLPPMQTTSIFDTALYPYTRSHLVFTDNLTNQPFVPNPALSGLSLGTVSGDPSTIPVFASAQVATDGYKTVAYLDGHVTHGIVTPPTQSPDSADVSNLHQLTLAILLYAQDHDEYLPFLRSVPALSAALQPYLRTPARFWDPETGQPYLMNATLSGVSLANIEEPAATWVIQDSTPHLDGSINAAEVDGRVTTTYAFIPNTLAVGPDDVTHLVWAKADGTTAFNTLSATGVVEGAVTHPSVGGRVAGYAVAPDETQRLLLNLGSGSEVLEALSSTGSILNTSGDGPYDGWTPGPLAVTSTGLTFLPWDRYDGSYALRVLSASGQPLNTGFFTLSAAWKVSGAAAAPDGTARVLMAQADGAVVENATAAGQITSRYVSVNAGFVVVGIAVGPDGLVRLLWATPDNQAELWTLSASGALLRNATLSSASRWAPVGVSIGPDGNARILFRNAIGNARISFVSPTGVTLATLGYAPPG